MATVRLPEALLESAEEAGKLSNRSRRQQIEFWAEIGRRVEPNITPEQLEAVRNGSATFVINKPSE